MTDSPATLAAQQRAFLAHMRDPNLPLPPAANPRAMAIYTDLVYRNLNGLLSQFFPVCYSISCEQAWEALVRRFIAQHPSQTPYFLAIAEEFLQFLINTPASLVDLPPYFVELAHYEWVELALDIADIPQPTPAAAGDNPWLRPWQCSPLAWCLAYQYPVHLIGPNNPNPAPTPSAYVVYRNSALEVKFIALTAASAQWLQTIEPPNTPLGALEAIMQGEISALVKEQTEVILREWIELGVLIPA